MVSAALWPVWALLSSSWLHNRGRVYREAILDGHFPVLVLVTSYLCHLESSNHGLSSILTVVGTDTKQQDGVYG